MTHPHKPTRVEEPLEDAILGPEENPVAETGKKQRENLEKRTRESAMHALASAL